MRLGGHAVGDEVEEELEVGVVRVPPAAGDEVEREADDGDGDGDSDDDSAAYSLL